jgi:hypothetical protein
MNGSEFDQGQVLMNIHQSKYADHLRETAHRDHFRSAELGTLKGSARASIRVVRESARSLVCSFAPMQSTSVCAVPA